MTHTCHWTGCKEETPPKLWGCRKHWYMLPLRIRNEIWRTYREGQEIDKSPSEYYLAAAEAARKWIEDNYPHPPKAA